MYLIQIDHVIYERQGGGLFTLPEAMRAVYGVAGARVLREDGSVAVLSAGNARAVEHLPSWRTVKRGPVRRTRRRAVR